MTRPVHGLRAWVLQRVSALYLLVFTLAAAFAMIVAPPSDYQQWHQWVANPAINIAIALFFLSVLVHSWVGVRDVIMDYVHHLAARFVLLLLLALALLASGIWVARILIMAASS
jgi:succinate dehydrogenase / fumarate reductase membrane anchor subunit